MPHSLTPDIGSIMKSGLKKRISSFQIILLGFAGVILFGSLLLCFPFSSKAREWTPFIDTLFTSVSAVCVTGLVVYDTATHWSLFGQIVILSLIQIGGMGVVTVASSFALLSGKKIGLFTRETMKEAISAPTVGGIVRLTGFILKGIFITEAVGALLLMPSFCGRFGPEGIWISVFTSVSAFCNAGFDLMGGKTGKFSSLTGFAADPLVNVTIMLLIAIGGIGFLVWRDVLRYGIRFRRYSTQSKLVLIASGILIVVPAVCFFFAEFSALPTGERILASLFQSVTTRTAGFNTVDLSTMKESGIFLMIGLMLIGGSPGSTAGGMKTTTIAILVCSAYSVFRQRSETNVLKRRADPDTVRRAASVFLVYMTLFWFGGMLIGVIENLPMTACLFETASAVGTVGLSLGLTPTLGIASKLILIVCMYFGRVGVMTLIYATFGRYKSQNSKYPIDGFSVG